LNNQIFTVEFLVNYLSDYFLNYDYDIISGSSLLDPSVPMTFVMSAGLVQVESSNSFDSKKNCYALVQNCFRYFDMKNIGVSLTHLSLFKMFGIFCLNSTNKYDNIQKIWKLLTKNFGLLPESLWVTYFSGDKIINHEFEPDLQAYNILKKLGIFQDHILGQNANHNFWIQGDMILDKKHISKCGSNVEFFFDFGEDKKCGPKCSPGCRCGRFVEIVNILFVSYEINEKTKSVHEAKRPFIEIVIGVERIAMLLQNVLSIYEIDSIKPLIKHIQQYCSKNNQEKSIKSKYIIADHIRAILFLVVDGAPSPGKGGRARLMRQLVRGLLTNQKLLNISNTFFIKSLVDTACNLYINKNTHIELIKQTILNYIESESKIFEKTIIKAMLRFNKILNQNDNRYINAKDILCLEKYYGLPLLLIENELTKKKVSYNKSAYDFEHAEWKKALSEGDKYYNDKK